LLLIVFIISQWVYQMIIQAHLGIMVDGFGSRAWLKRIGKLLAKIAASCPTFQPKTS
jgi:hypothetical protein